MGDPEWAAIRRAYRHTVHVHRRLAVAFGLIDLALIVFAIWNLVTGAFWICSLLLAMAFGGVWFLVWLAATIRDAEHRLRMIDGF